jgi:putative copper export protein/methionine-rich copper-binding protein CopC
MTIILSLYRFKLSLLFSLGIVVVVAWFSIISPASTIQNILPAAYGHAIPSTYSIEPNSILQRESTPSELVISFSERPDPEISYIRVTNSENERIDNDDFTVSGSNPRQAAVTLDTSKLGADGVYTVSWRALSLDDGHIAQGSYVFGLGNVTPEGISSGNQESQSQTITYVTSTADALLRWPLIVAQSAIVGAVMAYFVLQRGGRRDLSSLSKRYNPLSFDLNLLAKKRFALILMVGALAIAISGTALVFLQASNLDTDNDNSSNTSNQYLSTVRSLIFGSPAGVVWTVRIATSALIAVLALLYFVLAKRVDVQRKSFTSSSFSSAILLAILATGAASIFSNSMLSHNSAAIFLPSVAVFADWLHFMAVSAWVGGLFYFSAVLLLSIKSENESKSAAYILSIILPRFSLIATASLGIIGITGLYMAWIHLQTLDSLFYTPYGNNLIIKLSAALPMVILGAYHQVKLHKTILVMATIGGSREGSQKHMDTTKNNTANNAVSKFGKTIKLESLIGIGVLFAASLLTITSPPTQMTEQEGGAPPPPAVSEMGMQNNTMTTPSYSEQATISGVDITLEITPFHAGFNTFTVTLRDAATGSAPQNINAVFLRLTNAEARIGPIVTTLNSADDGSGRYSVIGGYLSQTGNWKIDLIAQRIGAYDLNHSFDAALGASSDHQNMDMSQEMNMHTQDHEASTSTTITTTSTNTNATEDELESPSAPPAFDSFAWLAIGLSIVVGAGSAFYFRKSKKQLEGTLETLERNMNS